MSRESRDAALVGARGVRWAHPELQRFVERGRAWLNAPAGDSEYLELMGAALEAVQAGRITGAQLELCCDALRAEGLQTGALRPNDGYFTVVADPRPARRWEWLEAGVCCTLCNPVRLASEAGAGFIIGAGPGCPEGLLELCADCVDFAALKRTGTLGLSPDVIEVLRRLGQGHGHGHEQ